MSDLIQEYQDYTPTNLLDAARCVRELYSTISEHKRELAEVDKVYKPILDAAIQMMAANGTDEFNCKEHPVRIKVSEKNIPDVVDDLLFNDFLISEMAKGVDEEDRALFSKLMKNNFNEPLTRLREYLTPKLSEDMELGEEQGVENIKRNRITVTVRYSK